MLLMTHRTFRLDLATFVTRLRSMQGDRRWVTWWLGTNPIRFAAGAWIAVAVLAAVVSAEFLIYPWIYERVAHGGEAAVAPGQWFAIDFLVVIWSCASQLALLAVGLAAWATWRVWARRASLLTSKVTRSLVLSGTLISCLGVAALAMVNLPSALGLTLRMGCGTRTFDNALSPNGRYVASVVEIDCGAMSSTHRQVVVRRRLLWWTTASVLYFNDEPLLHLSWKGRTLTISGDRPVNSMAHPPPDPMVWGGVVARYAGPRE
ncbi:MAG: hypothetical protein ABI051_02455 [Vicinamibacterales bacterium]